MQLARRVLIFAGIGAAILMVQHGRTGSPSTELGAVPAPIGDRTQYLAGRYPLLSSPDGTQHIVKSVLNVPERMHYGDYIWKDAGVPAGKVWIRVDLGHQTLSVFRADHEIGSTVILYGTDGFPTPSGVFPVLERAAQHRSTLYDAEMPYMLRLTQDGVAIHASNVRSGAATHGCIGIPPAFAKLLFDQVRRGDEVTILAAR